MLHSQFLYRFWQYQKERCPLFVLLCTTTAVAISTSRALSLPMWHMGIVVAVLTGVLIMFHIRLLDELKDYAHDIRYYPQRAISRGLISLAEVRKLLKIALLVELLLNVWLGGYTILVLLVLQLYTLLAGKDFLVGRWLRKYFFLYNLILITQLALVMVYLYVAVGATNAQVHIPRWHFAFTFLTFALVEWVRKMRPSHLEVASRDTYTARLGPKTASLVAGGIGAAAWLLAVVTLHEKFWVMGVTGLVLLLYITVLVGFSRNPNAKSSGAVQVTAVLAFVIWHLLL